MLRFLLGEGKHVEGICLHIVGDIVGAGNVVASLAPFVAPSECFSGHVGHEFKIGNSI